MKTHKKIKITVCIILVLLAVAWVRNYEIVLRLNGLSKKDVTVLYMGLDDNGDEIKILQADKGEKLTGYYLQKNKLGIWKKVYDKQPDERGMLYLGWIRIASRRFFSPFRMMETYHEWHYIISGKNAVKEIVIPASTFPRNVTISIDQSQSDYTIHCVSYSGYDSMNEIQPIILRTLEEFLE